MLDRLSTQDLSTLDDEQDTPCDRPEVVVLTILHHPDGARVGERAELVELEVGVTLSVSRLAPDFGAGGSLRDPRVSRKPLWIRRESQRLVLCSASPKIRVDGAHLVGEHPVSMAAAREAGAIVELGRCVLLGLSVEAEPAGRSGEILGVGPAIRRVRDQVCRIATTAVPVLIRGESGVGKELVARALHQASPRRGRPWVTVNMAAVPVSVAAAELFGHGRGAFTGAVSARPGCFQRADGGTLFLDEIGETPADVQPQLLRALDSGEIQPVGQISRQVDVRLITATDADLERQVEQGHLRRALYYRLQQAEIRVPALRERRIDVPILLHHFLRGMLTERGRAALLDDNPPGRRPWLGVELIGRLMAHAFPGNVRELRNIASQIVLGSFDQPVARLPDTLQLTPGALPKVGRGLAEDPLEDALCRHEWNVSHAAAALGMSRNAVIMAIKRHPRLRLAADLDASTIASAVAVHGDRLPTLAAALRVSPHGLKLRMRALGLSR